MFWHRCVVVSAIGIPTLWQPKLETLLFYILNILILVKVQLTENKEYIIFICITRVEDNSIPLYFLDLPRFLGGTLVSLAAKKEELI